MSGRSDTTFDDMVDLDLKYIEEQGVLTDFKVIFKTVAVVFTGKGAC
ncbi:MAG: sugar transferase [Gordonibacter urolithinfaciens]